MLGVAGEGGHGGEESCVHAPDSFQKGGCLLWGWQSCQMCSWWWDHGPRGTDLLFLGQPTSWPSIQATARAAWNVGRGPRGGGDEGPRGHIGWGSASPSW